MEGKGLTDLEWARFFDLLDRIVDLPFNTYAEKAKEVERKSTENGSETSLQEFVSWYGGEV